MYHRASWGYECARIYARICGPVSVRYRSSETNCQYGHRHKCTYGCLFIAIKSVVVFYINLSWCNLLIQVVNMIIVRSV